MPAGPVAAFNANHDLSVSVNALECADLSALWSDPGCKVCFLIDVALGPVGQSGDRSPHSKELTLATKQIDSSQRLMR